MSKTKQKIAACIALLSLVLPAGNGALAENTNSNLENGLETIQDAMNRMNGQAALTETIDDLREGSSEDTVPTTVWGRSAIIPAQGCWRRCRSRMETRLS